MQLYQPKCFEIDLEHIYVVKLTSHHCNFLLDAMLLGVPNDEMEPQVEFFHPMFLLHLFFPLNKQWFD